MSDQESKSGAGKISDSDSFKLAILEAHQKACENQEYTYIDPETGLQVLTEFYLKQRGYCCTNKCRHCAYGIHDLKKVKD